jgi:phosphatidylglycerophosphatase A
MEKSIMEKSLVTDIFKRDYTNIAPIPEKVWQDPLYFIAFGFGTGTIPFAPGTFGTLLAIPIYLLMAPLRPLPYFILLLAIIALSMWICGKVTKEIGVADHQGMNLDEIVGYLVTMFYIPLGWGWMLAGFVLFRLFDIWKPWPINLVDRNVHGGVGIILDDVLAGLFSCVILFLIAVF